MTSYVLIVVLLNSNGFSVPAFASRDACEIAAKQLEPHVRVATCNPIGLPVQAFEVKQHAFEKRTYGHRLVKKTYQINRRAAARYWER